MSGFTDSEEQDLLEYWFAGTALPNTPTHIALYTSAPGESSSGTEVTGGSYARVAVARNGTNWGSSVSANPSTIENLLEILFIEATASWGTVVAWGYLTASSGGTLLFYADLDANKAIESGVIAQFIPGSLVAKLGDPGDSY